MLVARHGREYQREGQPAKDAEYHSAICKTTSERANCALQLLGAWMVVVIIVVVVVIGAVMLFLRKYMAR
ncbi:MAG TPA: hypothetical protein VFD85_03360 [Gemmatimonadales bacterium]|nr:hypothetical protein [Gemmatimonadales bacterium]